MSASDRVGYTRSNLNNSAFTKSDIAEMYSTTADKISTVTYNGVQYFIGETNYSSDTYGIDLSVSMTQLVYIDNGWMYMFQFGGTSSHKLYTDFEELLNSVQYPTVSNVSEGSSVNNIPSGTDNIDDSSVIVAVIVLLMIVTVIVVAVVLTRKKVVEKEIESSYTPNYNTNSPEPQINPEATISCKNCGRALPLDSVFCHVCGTRIHQEEN